MTTLEDTLKQALGASSVDHALALIEAAWSEAPNVAIRDVAVGLKAPTLFSRKSREVEAAARAAMAEPPSSRVSAALEQLLTDVPFTADSSKPAWAAVFSLVKHVADPRFIELAQTLPKQWAIRPIMKAWLTKRFADAVEELPASSVSLSPSALEVIDQLKAKISQRAPRAVENADELWHAVYAAPFDDAPRQVLADFLQERGDPRGEFIALQLMPVEVKTKEAQKREKALLKASLTTWLGELAPVVSKGNAVFTRGFLSAATVRFKNEQDAKKFGSLPSWATVEHLTHAQATSISQLKWAYFISPQMRALKAIGSMPGVSIPFLAASKTPWAIEEAAFFSVDHDDVLELIRLGASLLPKLSVVRVSKLQAQWLGNTSLPPGWKSLRVTNDSAELPKLLAVLEANSALERLVATMPESGEFHFERDGAGRLRKLRIRGSGYSAQMLSTLSDMPPGSLSEFIIDTPSVPNQAVIDRLSSLLSQVPSALV